MTYRAGIFRCKGKAGRSCVLKPVERSAQRDASSLKKDSDIPMYMKQFKDLKAKHPDALLLFRTGDFYTSFEEDAVKAWRFNR